MLALLGESQNNYITDIKSLYPRAALDLAGLGYTLAIFLRLGAYDLVGNGLLAIS